MEQQQQELQDKENQEQELQNTSQKLSNTSRQRNNDITYQNTTLSKTKSPTRNGFILDCDNRKKSRLPNYNGLTDKFLAPFFQNSKIRNNLLKSGLINNQNEIIETKKTVQVPFQKLDPIVQRKHICHVVPKRKAVSNKHYQQMSQSSNYGSKCFSISQTKKMYLYEKLPPLKTPKQGSKIHLPEIYLEKNFHQFATQYLQFLQNNSIDLNQSLERQFIEKYKTQQRKKIIKHTIPLHTQIRGVKEDCLAWKFSTEVNSSQQQQQKQFGYNKNNFYKQNNSKRQEEEQEEYSDDEFDKDEENYDNDDKEKKSEGEYDDEFETEDAHNNQDKVDEIEDEEDESKKKNQSNYSDDVDDFEDEEEQGEKKLLQDSKNNFEDEKQQKNEKVDNEEYDGNDFEDDDDNEIN